MIDATPTAAKPIATGAPTPVAAVAPAAPSKDAPAVTCPIPPVVTVGFANSIAFFRKVVKYLMKVDLNL